MNRIAKELRELAKADTSGVTAAPVNAADITKLEGSLTGPKDTPYEGGVFRVTIELTRNYPFEPPKVKFITPLWCVWAASRHGTAPSAPTLRVGRLTRCRVARPGNAGTRT